MTHATYSITIHDLFRVEDGVICGDEAVVAIFDNGLQIDQQRFVGKCTSPGGYTRRYRGKPGLTAALLSGSCRMSFAPIDPPMADLRHP